MYTNDIFIKNIVFVIGMLDIQTFYSTSDLTNKIFTFLQILLKTKMINRDCNLIKQVIVLVNVTELPMWWEDTSKYVGLW